MTYVLLWPDEELMARSGFSGIANVPAIFDGKWRYQAEVSWYLRDRSKGQAFEPHRDVRRFPTRDSMETYARALTDFLEWCDWVKRDWRKIEYKSDLVDRYQDHMLAGSWSAARVGLKPRTVNLRVDEAVHFLSWAARKELRPSFHVSGFRTSRMTGGASATGKSVVVTSRTGKARPAPIDLRIPTTLELQKWLNYVSLRKGPTKSLMCELIVSTGIREQECAQWRTFTLPSDRNEWNIKNGFLSVQIEYGAKGPKQRNGRGELVGPSRRISIPISIAEKLARYAGAPRTKSRMKYVNGAASASERRKRQLEREDRLFVSEYDGRPITAHTLYKAWADVPAEYKPYPEWSPHLGRHYWACSTLWNGFVERELMLADGVVATSDWVSASASSDLLMLIKPQLGHVDEKTTQAYLVWVREMARAHAGPKSSGPTDYSHWLEEENA